MKHINCKTKKHITYIRNSSGKVISTINDLECLDHNVVCCRCGKGWGQHDASYVVEPSDKCAWCGGDIPGTEEYYMKFGNACESCRGKFANRN